jgi:hypothetical protein
MQPLVELGAHLAGNFRRDEIDPQNALERPYPLPRREVRRRSGEPDRHGVSRTGRTGVEQEEELARRDGDDNGCDGSRR